MYERSSNLWEENMTNEQIEKAKRLLIEHEYEKRYIPIDIRNLLEQIVKDALKRNT